MSSQRFTPEFKEEAVRQVVGRGHSVAEVAARLGVSTHSLYQWVKAVKPDKTEQQVAELTEAKSEILRLRAQLRRVEEERDILKKAAARSTGRCNIIHDKEIGEMWHQWLVWEGLGYRTTRRRSSGVAGRTVRLSAR